MTEQRDVIVVGGGVIGSAAAWQLAGRGHEVTLLERFPAGHAFGASHGSARIFRLGYPHQTYIALARRAQDLWRELEDLTGTELLTITGGIAHGRPDYLTPLAEALERAGLRDSRWLKPGEAVERWPGFVFDGPVFYQPYSGRLHADRSVAALQDGARRHGAEIRHESAALRITADDERAVEVVTDAETLRAKRLVVAAGAWTRPLLAGQVALPRLRVTQEQPVHFAARVPEREWPAFGHIPAGTGAGSDFHGGIYGLAAPGEGIKVGFHGVGPEADPDARDFRSEPGQLADLQAYARRWLPGVDADEFTEISCTYTTSPDSDFILDRRGPVVVAAGFSGHGFKHAPAVGELLADLATTAIPADPLFALTRAYREGVP